MTQKSPCKAPMHRSLCPQQIEDVLAIAQGPVIDMHANARALCSHRPNLTDAQFVLSSSGLVVRLMDF